MTAAGIEVTAAPIAVVSPHCDDAVFSCGRLLAAHPGAAVVTVLVGGPPPSAEITEWDRASGFDPGDDVVASRRDEDRRALALLGARPVWLAFHDGQYGRSPGADDVAGVLDTALDLTAATAIFVPLGLFHRDHRLTHEAALAVRARKPRWTWFLYADAIYRRVPGLVGERLDRLAADGLQATPVDLGGGDGERKRRAVRCYRSQLRALTTPGRPGYDDVFAAEAYWRIAA